ncbi:MAG: dihydroxy-acid dehydratase [SAR324 cluster bacterium]|nr:dihydroxy-acid dehydratase [SAR324 cluster bacterium]
MADSRNKLRSQAWWSGVDRNALLHRERMRNQGPPSDMFDGRPVIGICNTFSEFNPCNAHFRELAEAVRRGVYQAGGFPLEFPTMSLGEPLMRPTTMLFRNLMSMDVEETIRANPMDGVVLLTGCDKTTPASLMGAASVDLPTIVVSGGPMLKGKFRGNDLGSGTDIWRLSEEVRAGHITTDEFMEAEQGMARSNGFCMTMGTASTMASLCEALGMTLSGATTIPAVDSRLYLNATLAGRRIVDMVKENLRMSKVLTRPAFENAIRVNAAIGGSTNAVVHLLAVAGRMGVPLELEDFDRLGHDMPLLVNLQPSGEYLMEDFYYAGGLPVVIREISGTLNADTVSVSGKSIVENSAKAECFNRDVIAEWAKPLREQAGIAVLHGNLCPDGAVIKPSAATPSLLKHRGRAVVFKDIEDFYARVDDPDLDIDETSVMVLQGAGPRGYPGFPELGNLPLPKKVLEKGITDMVRISDARMSGTAYGAVVLHISPESAVGGPLALIQDGDPIELDVEARRLHLDVPDAELEQRRNAWNPGDSTYHRGYARLYVDHVTQAHQGADFDFLIGKSGDYVPRESH